MFDSTWRQFGNEGQRWMYRFVSCQRIVKHLTAIGANVDASDNDGRTALHLACIRNQVVAVKYLIESGANVEVKSKNNRTALHFAGDKGHHEIIEILIQHGANVNAVTMNGITSIHLASSRNNFAIVRLLSEHGAIMDASTNTGVIVLHFAVVFGQLNLVHVLLKYDRNDKIILPTNEYTSTSYHPAKPNAPTGKLDDKCANALDSTIDVMGAIQLVMEFGRFEIVRDIIEKFHCRR
jgi:ankyrin repeat protein